MSRALFWFCFLICLIFKGAFYLCLEMQGFAFNFPIDFNKKSVHKSFVEIHDTSDCLLFWKFTSVPQVLFEMSHQSHHYSCSDFSLIFCLYFTRSDHTEPFSLPGMVVCTSGSLLPKPGCDSKSLVVKNTDFLAPPLVILIH